MQAFQKDVLMLTVIDILNNMETKLQIYSKIYFPTYSMYNSMDWNGIRGLSL